MSAWTFLPSSSAFGVPAQALVLPIGPDGEVDPAMRSDIERVRRDPEMAASWDELIARVRDEPLKVQDCYLTDRPVPLRPCIAANSIIWMRHSDDQGRVLHANLAGAIGTAIRLARATNISSIVLPVVRCADESLFSNEQVILSAAARARAAHPLIGITLTGTRPGLTGDALSALAAAPPIDALARSVEAAIARPVLAPWLPPPVPIVLPNVCVAHKIVDAPLLEGDFYNIIVWNSQIHLFLVSVTGEGREAYDRATKAAKKARSLATDPPACARDGFDLLRQLVAEVDPPTPRLSYIVCDVSRRVLSMVRVRNGRMPPAIYSTRPPGFDEETSLAPAGADGDGSNRYLEVPFMAGPAAMAFFSDALSRDMRVNQNGSVLLESAAIREVLRDGYDRGLAPENVVEMLLEYAQPRPLNDDRVLVLIDVAAPAEVKLPPQLPPLTAVTLDQDELGEEFSIALVRFAEKHKLPTNTYADMLVACEEALQNVYEHGEGPVEPPYEFAWGERPRVTVRQRKAWEAAKVYPPPDGKPGVAGRGSDLITKRAMRVQPEDEGRRLILEFQTSAA